MKADHSDWLEYANENLSISRLALDGGYYNACLQNVQQAVEKFLKAALLKSGQQFPRTHSIESLKQQLADIGIEVGLSDEDCDLLDAIYVPSKYPLGEALPDFRPDEALGAKCIAIGERARRAVGFLFE